MCVVIQNSKKRIGLYKKKLKNYNDTIVRSMILTVCG